METDISQRVADEVLRLLYPGFFGAEIGPQLLEFRNRSGISEAEFDNILDELSTNQLIRAFAAGFSYDITPKGILLAEDNRLVPDEVATQNRSARTSILDALAKLREQEGKLASLHFQQVVEATGIDPKVVVYNTILLEQLNYVEATAGPFSRITDRGMDAVIEWRKQTALVTRFEEILKLEPHQRGIALQTLIANTAEMQGWEADESVRNSNEEFDVILSKGRDFFFVECKWLKGPVETKELHAFFAKLSIRDGVMGMLVSMSGFTSGVQEAVLAHLGTRAILLFGDKSIKSMIYERVPLEDLINAKCKQLVTRKFVDEE